MQSGEYGRYYTSNTSLSPDEQKVNAAYIYRWLMEHGWAFNAICGMLGNFQRESTINPGRWQGGVRKDSKGFGLVQWTPSTKFRDWAKSRGLNENSLDAQLERIEWELANGKQWITKSSYPLSFAQFKVSAESPGYLAKAFGVNYERSGAILAGGSEAEATLNARANYAEEWYTYLSGLPIDVPEQPEPVDYPDGISATVIASKGNTVNFREQPSVETGEIIEKIPVGSVVTVYRQDPIWCEIGYNGNRGYMMTEFLDISSIIPEPKPPDIVPDDGMTPVPRATLVALRDSIDKLLK